VEISGRDLVSPKRRAAKSLGASQIDPQPPLVQAGDSGADAPKRHLAADGEVVFLIHEFPGSAATAAQPSPTSHALALGFEIGQ
jgi:hypothetical protein